MPKSLHVKIQSRYKHLYLNTVNQAYLEASVLKIHIHPALIISLKVKYLSRIAR